MKNIVLIGMRGTGKTTVAKLLSQKLNLLMSESDELVVEKAGMSIPEIVDKHGWDHFRNLEEQIIEELADISPHIISTGGGVVLKPNNVKKLQQTGYLILLTASLETMLERIGDDPNRVSLTGSSSRKKDIEKTWNERKAKYENAADAVFHTNAITPEDVTDHIVAHLIKEGII